MINKNEINRLAQEQKVRTATIDKDWVSRPSGSEPPPTPSRRDVAASGGDSASGQCEIMLQVLYDLTK